MQGRTFLRIMFENLFVNNALSKTIIQLVKFCQEQWFYGNPKHINIFKTTPNSVKNSKSDYKFIFK